MAGRARQALSPERGERKGKLILFRPDRSEERFVVPEGDYDLQKLGQEAEQSVRAFYIKKALEAVAAVIVAAVGVFSEH